MSERPNFKKISIYEGPQQSPGFLLWHMSTTWRTSIESVLKMYGLTHPQFVVLASAGWLNRNGESTTQTAIGKMAGLDPNTTSQIIKGLEQKKLIRREKCSDGRAKNVILTPNGNIVLSLAMPEVEKADAKFFSVLSKQEANQLLRLFQLLATKK